MSRAAHLLRHVPLCADVIACWALAWDAVGLSFGAHALASLTAGCWSAWRAGSGEARLGGTAAGLLVLLLPAFGAALLLLVVWPAWQRSGCLGVAHVFELALPGATREARHALPVAPRPLRELLDDGVAEGECLRGVMALRTLNAHRAVPLLRRAFAHRSEEVRLLAFAILEGREKRLRGRIRSLGQRLAELGPAPENASRRAACHRRLAQQHWELVYGGFVSSDLEPAVLEAAAEHALASLTDAGGDLGSALLLARIRLRQRRAVEAWSALERAELAGAPHACSAPLFAEAAYMLGRFEAIPRLLGRVAPAALRRPGLAQVAEFWMGASPA